MPWTPLVVRTRGLALPVPGIPVALSVDDPLGAGALERAWQGDRAVVVVHAVHERPDPMPRVGHLWTMKGLTGAGDRRQATLRGEAWVRVEEVREADGAWEARFEVVDQGDFRGHPLHEAFRVPLRALTPSTLLGHFDSVHDGTPLAALADLTAYNLGPDAVALVLEEADPLERAVTVRLFLEAEVARRAAALAQEPTEPPALQDDLGPQPESEEALAAWLATLRARHGLFAAHEVRAWVERELGRLDPVAAAAVDRALDAHRARAGGWARPTDAERLVSGLSALLPERRIAFSFAEAYDPHDALDEMEEAFAPDHAGVAYATEHDLDAAAMGHGLRLRFHGFRMTDLEVGRALAGALAALGLPVHWPERDDVTVVVPIRWELPLTG